MINTSIQPHSASWDILRSGDYIYYVRNDLSTSKAVALRYTSGSSGKPRIMDVCAEMSGGKAYFGRKSNHHYKYCIKGTKWIRVNDLTKGTHLKTGELHKDFQNGDHYYLRNHRFFVIKLGRFGSSDSLSKGINNWQPLNSNTKGALCYWGDGNFTYMLMEDDKLGMVHNRMKNFEGYGGLSQYPVSESRLNFMPGGLAKTYGPVVANWELMGSKDNTDGKRPVKFSYQFNYLSGAQEDLTSVLDKAWSDYRYRCLQAMTTSQLIV